MATSLPASAPKTAFAVPVLESVKRNKSERRVTLPEVLAALVEDDRVTFETEVAKGAVTQS